MSLDTCVNIRTYIYKSYAYALVKILRLKILSKTLAKYEQHTIGLKEKVYTVVISFN